MASSLVAACGAAFHTNPDEPVGGAPSGEAGETQGGRGGAPAAPGGAGASVGGETEAGAGGAGEALSCSVLGGVERDDGHCYLDVTTVSATQPAAVAACAALTLDGRPAHLLVLDTAAEQDFVLERFLLQFQDVSDAWLGLTCAADSHPDSADCYCKDCSDDALLQKQQAWSWLDGTSATFGWVNANPNSAARCAALAFNPTTTLLNWGWVERACDLTEVTPIAEHPHTYRTICEID